MKFKRLSLISFAAFIGFTLFYIGLNQWQHEKESTGKINIVSNMPQENIPPIQPNQTPTNQPPNTQTNSTNQTQPPNTPNTQSTQTTTQNPSPTTQTTQPTQNMPQTTASFQPKTQIQAQTLPKNNQKPIIPKQNTQLENKQVVFQIGAFKSSISAQNAINKASSLGFSPIVKQEKGFYIVRVKLNGSKDGIKLLTAFPGAFRVQ